MVDITALPERHCEPAHYDNRLGMKGAELGRTLGAVRSGIGSATPATGITVNGSVYVLRRGMKFSEAEFMQYRKCVGGGPSSKTCSR
jgi:hypothetical protein